MVDYKYIEDINVFEVINLYNETKDELSIVVKQKNQLQQEKQELIEWLIVEIKAIDENLFEFQRLDEIIVKQITLQQILNKIKESESE